MPEKCPKCGSGNTYLDECQLGWQNACQKCGKRWPLAGQKQTVIKQIFVEDEEEMPRQKLDGPKIKELIKSGKTIPEIIAETGFNKGSVCSFLRREGLKPQVDGRSLRYKNKGEKSTVKSYPSSAINPKRKKTRKYTLRKKSSIDVALLKNEDAIRVQPGIDYEGINPDSGIVINLIDAQIDEYQKRITKLTKAREILTV
jgi:hypothetical protein